MVSSITHPKAPLERLLLISVDVALDRHLKTATLMYGGRNADAGSSKRSPADLFRFERFELAEWPTARVIRFDHGYALPVIEFRLQVFDYHSVTRHSIINRNGDFQWIR